MSLDTKFSKNTTLFKTSILLLMIVTVLLLSFYFDLYHYLTIDALKKYHLALKYWTDTHYFSALFFYNIIFIVLIACAIPCATVLTILGGFLFGYSAIIFAIMDTTLGGVILFFSVRTALGGKINAKAGTWIKKIETGLKNNAFNYILMLRLVPIFPCWISNVGAGVLNVPFKIFFLATILGITPATIVYGMAGCSLEEILQDDNLTFLSILNKPSVLLPLLALVVLILIPVVYKGMKK